VIIVIAIAYFAHAWCRREQAIETDAPAAASLLATAD
jgi:hypothetical protein